MRRTCADIEGTVQATEGSHPCWKADKMCFWSNASGLFLGHCLGQGMLRC